jgi:dethiobiotin synthase
VSTGVFVTGTGTGVGKTVAAAALLTLRRRRGRVQYWKPVQTGIESDDDTATVARLAGCAADEVMEAGIRLPKPVSPHLAARLAGVSMDVDGILAIGGAAPRVPSTDHFLIVEGAGGVLVPLSDREMMIDLMTRLALPVVVVAQTALGTINHTLLTLEALRRRRLDVAFVVMSGDADAAAREAIAHHGAVPVVELPRFDPLDAPALAAWAVKDGASWPI